MTNELETAVGGSKEGLIRHAVRLLAVVPAVLILTVTSSGALAYSGSGAAHWADQNWGSYSAEWQHMGAWWWDRDCANFVSNALNRGGGYSQVGDIWHNSQTDDNYWFFNYWSGQGWYWSNSFTVTRDQYTFQIAHWPGGFQQAPTQWSDNTGAYNKLLYGDEAFYNWGEGEGWSHVSIEVNYGGRDPDSGWYGDLVDVHNNDRYHAYWSLAPYNSRHQYTTIFQMHIDSRNN